VAKELELLLIIECYNTLMHAKIMAWLAQRPRFLVHYTPTFAYWLTQVER
jgi:putative transposase